MCSEIRKIHLPNYQGYYENDDNGVDMRYIFDIKCDELWRDVIDKITGWLLTTLIHLKLAQSLRKNKKDRQLGCLSFLFTPKRGKKKGGIDPPFLTATCHPERRNVTVRRFAVERGKTCNKLRVLTSKIAARFWDPVWSFDGFLKQVLLLLCGTIDVTPASKAIGHLW